MSSIRHNSIEADAELAELRHEFGVEHRLYLQCKHDLAVANAKIAEFEQRQQWAPEDVARLLGVKK